MACVFVRVFQCHLISGVSEVQRASPILSGGCGVYLSTTLPTTVLNAPSPFISLPGIPAW
ncbi:hypothetical protein E2C01_048648 [Portunus trituberculatus]|uniref:Uncharacterized protein n=1 Tax=Portunus trituberculatus TaxID=210409 RepID=A0A5B7GBP2_PORTR|nr:hypothetical protein [Portunus trituberculatus]